jgi:hypothetical protein
MIDSFVWGEILIGIFHLNLDCNMYLLRKVVCLLGVTPIGTITLDPSFASFILLESISH